ncbi:GntR family transcriptional regulator [Rhizobium sp. RHZ02]|uniref:GntR family transcriptional regulator n=1 Tax=Rhizobium sp. RHZ02 TaxID=2769306 RepID=UPI00177E1EA3|nr:GntR family transcriptional regulator [Rhizobium sp. RHZ02]MBD9450272.1 GntR family transcriptional regulator [Rhizobium sp. RHZ02]
MNSADHHVYLAIREQVFDGRLPPNTFIHIQSLATLHKVSALPVREALIRLAAEDLVEYNKSRGFVPSLISLNTLIDSYDILYHIYQLNLRINIASRPADTSVDDCIIEYIAEGNDITAKSVDEALEIFAARLMREHFYGCFLRELRRTRPFRYQSFHLREDISLIAEYIGKMKAMVIKREYAKIYRMNREFRKYYSSDLTELYHSFVDNHRKKQVYNLDIS